MQVWRCISAKGVGDSVRINGLLIAEKYRQTLSHRAIPTGRHLIGPKFILQHDNDSKNTAKFIKSDVQRQEEHRVLEVMPHRAPISTASSLSGITRRERSN